MTSRRNRWGIAAAILVFGMMLGAPAAFADGAGLNGRWSTNDGLESVMNNGSFEDSLYGILSTKGTYRVANGKMTTIITHYHGDTLNAAAQGAGLASKWYSRNDTKAALGVPDEVLDTMFIEMTVNYSLNGNTLVLDNGAGNRFTYTRQ